MNVNYVELEDNIISGIFRRDLVQELIFGFRQIQQAGERLPLPSYYASKIAEIIGRGADGPLDPNLAFHLYQEILEACEEARDSVLSEAPLPS